MAFRTNAAWDASADDRPTVAAELTAIFARLPRLRSPAESAMLPLPARARAGGLRAWLIVLGAIALAALIGSMTLLAPVARQLPIQGEAKKPLPPTSAIAAPKVIHPPASIPPAVHAAQRARPAHAGACPRFAAAAWCMRGAILRADSRLRDAYEAAVRAGVDRETLVDVRRDWKRLCGRADRDPQALIRGYALLTQALRAEMRR